MNKEQKIEMEKTRKAHSTKVADYIEFVFGMKLSEDNFARRISELTTWKASSGKRLKYGIETYQYFSNLNWFKK